MSPRHIHPLTRQSHTPTVEVLEDSGVRRVLRISGGVRATVELDLRDERWQSLRVNGEPVRKSSALLGYLSVYPFTLPSSRGPVPATLEVDAHLWHAIRALRLRVWNEVIYSEGAFGEAHRGSGLPIPAAERVEGVGGLPTPAMPPEAPPDRLPLAARAEFQTSPSLLIRRQQWRRASSVALLALTVGGLSAGAVSIARMREQQLYGPTGAPRPVVTSRPRHRPGPYRPAPDPTPEQVRRRSR